MGLNGVDNGQIWFDSVRVPRNAMLDRYASVDAAGTYSSPIPTVSARFGTMVGGLTTGRILIAQGAVSGLGLEVLSTRLKVCAAHCSIIQRATHLHLRGVISSIHCKLSSAAQLHMLRTRF
jgi:acyl-CoA oxidase